MPRYDRSFETVSHSDGVLVQRVKPIQRGNRLLPAAETKPAPIIKQIKVSAFKAYLRYHVLPDDSKGDGRRWYYLGRVRVAFMNVYVPGTRMGGNFCVFTNASNVGNGGTWFMEEDEAHEFIVKELSE